MPSSANLYYNIVALSHLSQQRLLCYVCSMWCKLLRYWTFKLILFIPGSDLFCPWSGGTVNLLLVTHFDYQQRQNIWQYPTHVFSLIREWKKGGGRGVELIFGWKAWCPRKNIYFFLHLVTFFSFLSLFSRLQIRSKSGSSNNSEIETCSSIWLICDSVDDIFLGH